MKNGSLYKNVAAMEPLLPTSGRDQLSELSAEIFKKSGELKASLPAKIVRQEVALVIQQMNSYYSNLIEGHKTLPRDIERALLKKFSKNDEARRNQYMSVAHINAEEAMRKRLEETPATDVFSEEFICWLHEQFYNHLPQEEWFTTSISNKRYPIKPGKLRSYNVEVGKHTPPDYSVISDFLLRYQSFYTSKEIQATNTLIALAAAHHRLAWIHPFGDGNGRVARLQSQAAMIQCGVDVEGLWTLSRGLARARTAYYQKLQLADQKRANDYDGRGNLSDLALSQFCSFFLEQILDQIQFMVNLIEPFKLQERIENYLHFKRQDLDVKTRNYFAKLLKALVMQGEIARGKVPEILGLKQTASREIIGKALKDGLILTKSEKGALRIAFPSKVVEFYFPNLFTDLLVGNE